MVGMPGQMQSGPMSNVPCPSQIPSQMRMQLPGQMGGQLQGQIQGQAMGQMPQMPGQITNQMSHMTQMQQPRKVSGEVVYIVILVSYRVFCRHRILPCKKSDFLSPTKISIRIILNFPTYDVRM